MILSSLQFIMNWWNENDGFLIAGEKNWLIDKRKLDYLLPENTS